MAGSLPAIARINPIKVQQPRRRERRKIRKRLPLLALEHSSHDLIPFCRAPCARRARLTLTRIKRLAVADPLYRQARPSGHVPCDASGCHYAPHLRRFDPEGLARATQIGPPADPFDLSLQALSPVRVVRARAAPVCFLLLSRARPMIQLRCGGRHATFAWHDLGSLLTIGGDTSPISVTMQPILTPW